MKKFLIEGIPDTKRSGSVVSIEDSYIRRRNRNEADLEEGKVFKRSNLVRSTPEKKYKSTEELILEMLSIL